MIKNLFVYTSGKGVSVIELLFPRKLSFYANVQLGHSMFSIHHPLKRHKQETPLAIAYYFKVLRRLQCITKITLLATFLHTI